MKPKEEGIGGSGFFIFLLFLFIAIFSHNWGGVFLFLVMWIAISFAPNDNKKWYEKVIMLPRKIIPVFIKRLARAVGIKWTDEESRQVYNKICIAALICIIAYGSFMWLKEKDRWQMMLGVVIVPIGWLFDHFWRVVGVLALGFFIEKFIGLCRDVKRIADNIDAISYKFKNE